MAATVFTLAGCSGGTPTTPQPSTTVSSPPIPSALNGAKFTTDPCTAMTSEQLTSIGFTSPTQSQGREGECYVKLGTTSGVSISWNPTLHDSLNSLYSRHIQGLDTGNHWEELTVDGYPAVLVAIEENVPSRRADGPLSCSLALGIDQATLVTIKVNTYEDTATGPWQHDPCGATKKIAQFTVANLHN
jgi:hypothetical protein